MGDADSSNNMVSLDDLECHFKWKPELGSTKSEYSIAGVIKKVENKILRQPHLTVAYRCTLAYLYTVKPVLDFTEANEQLSSLSDLRELQNTDRWLDCDFLIQALHLHIRKAKDADNSVDMQLVESENQIVRKLTELWKCPRTKASVFLIKGLSLNCFGPTKLAEAVEAYKKALTIVEENPDAFSAWRKFDHLWCLAFTMCRERRQGKHMERNDIELDLWEKTLQWKKDNSLPDDALFYITYAEALVYIPERREECHTLAVQCLVSWESFAEEEKRRNDLIAEIALKIFIALNDKHAKEHALEIMKNSTVFNENEEFYYELAKTMSYDIENENRAGIELLRTGLSINSHHLWIDLHLIDRYFKIEDYKKAIDRYSSLLKKYDQCSKDVAQIYNRRSRSRYHNKVKNKQLDYLKHLDECFKDLKKGWTLNLESTCDLPGSYAWQLKVFLEDDGNRPEYLAWICERFFSGSSENEQIRSLYQKVFEFDQENGTARKEFALEFLGRHFLSQCEYKNALYMFQKLHEKHQERKFLISEAVSNLESECSLEQLLECISFGSCDVFSLILAKLEDTKQSTNLIDEARGENFYKLDHSNLFFKRSNFQICAEIDNVLENQNSLFLSGGKKVDDQCVVDQIRERIESLLEISDNTSGCKALREKRLRMCKEYLLLKAFEEPDTECGEDSKTIMENVDEACIFVLKEAKSLLDRCLSKFSGDTDRSHYPHAFQKTTRNEKKKHGNDEKARDAFLKKRLKNEWLPPGKNLELVVIEGHLREGFSGYSRRIPECVWKTAAKREHYIITCQGAWHAVWVDAVNSDKHVEAFDRDKFEKELNEYRRIAGLNDPPVNKAVTMYDVAHWAAEFAEQTILMFNFCEYSHDNEDVNKT